MIVMGDYDDFDQVGTEREQWHLQVLVVALVQQVVVEAVVEAQLGCKGAGDIVGWQK